MATTDNPQAPDTSEGLHAGNRHDLRHDLSPDAPETDSFTEGAYGYVHSYETGSRLDGPGIRVTIFVSGCPLRCQYCHNPDTWHLKHGTHVPLERVVTRLGDFAPALRSMGGGLTISGGEPMVQIPFTQGIFAAAKSMGLERPAVDPRARRHGADPGLRVREDPGVCSTSCTSFTTSGGCRGCPSTWTARWPST